MQRAPRSLRLTALAVLTGSTLALVPPTAAPAAGRQAVDPALMQPALNPTFTWSCWRAGERVICDGERNLSWDSADTGLPCGDGTLYSTGTDSRTLRRWGDADGLALHSHAVADIRETLSLSPDPDAASVSGVAHFSERFTYGTPGEQSTRVVVQSGLDVRVTAPGIGLVLHDVGVKSFDIEDNVLFAHGPHPVLEDFDAAFAKVCDALLEISG